MFDSKYFGNIVGWRGYSRATLLLMILILLFRAGSAVAQDSKPLHFALTVSNDSLGDWEDRWRSSSVEVGILSGARNGEIPRKFGELLEYRFRSDVLMPANITNPRPDDRRHAGTLAFGVHSYFRTDKLDYRVGSDLVVVGQQTGLYDFQTRLHEILGFDIPNLPNFQIADTSRLDTSAEAGRVLHMGDWLARPFLEVRTGTEDMVRVGVDLMTGAGSDDLRMRVESTGHRVPYGSVHSPGRGFVAGADIAWVHESLYLPEHLGYTLTSARARLRGGFSYTAKRFEVFYGLAWLGREFEAQPEGQFVGTLQAKLAF